MFSRSVRVNELVKRELNSILRENYPKEALYITITKVKIAPDLRQGWVYYSVFLEDERFVAENFFKQYAKHLEIQLKKYVVLKYFPSLSFLYDDSVKKGSELLNRLDEIE